MSPPAEGIKLDSHDYDAPREGKLRPPDERRDCFCILLLTLPDKLNLSKYPASKQY